MYFHHLMPFHQPLVYWIFWQAVKVSFELNSWTQKETFAIAFFGDGHVLHSALAMREMLQK